MKPSILSRKTTRRAGSGLSIGGLLLVCVCFFLPFSRGCIRVPAEGHLMAIPAWDDTLDPVLVDNPHLPPLVFAGLVPLVAVLRRWRWGRVTATVVLMFYLALLAVDAAHYVYWLLDELSSHESGDDLRGIVTHYLSASTPYLLAFSLVGLVLLVSVSRRRRWRRVTGTAVMVCCLAYLAADSFLLGYQTLGARKDSLLFPAVLLVHAGLLAGGVLFIARRKAWRWRSIVPWSGLLASLFATGHFLWWEWLCSNNDEALYGLHLTVLGFATATVGFLLLLLHHRSARRWTLMRWHRSRQRAYCVALEATIARSAAFEKAERE